MRFRTLLRSLPPFIVPPIILTRLDARLTLWGRRLFFFAMMGPGFEPGTFCWSSIRVISCCRQCHKKVDSWTDDCRYFSLLCGGTHNSAKFVCPIIEFTVHHRVPNSMFLINGMQAFTVDEVLLLVQLVRVREDVSAKHLDNFHAR